MELLSHAANPFALMLDPAAVVRAMEQSDRLARLQSRICRPLDKPQVGAVAESAEEVVTADDFVYVSD